MDRHYQKIRKQAGLAGGILGSLLIGLPATAIPRVAVAKQVAQSNPHPSIFNEPPYNHSSSTSEPSSGTPLRMQPMPETGTHSTGRTNSSTSNSTSPQNPNQPATSGSPYLQQQQTGDATQPTKPTGSGGNTTEPNSTSPQNPNQPATNGSPYLQQQQTGDSAQPAHKPGTGNLNPPASVPGPYTQQQQKPGSLNEPSSPTK